jgi:hypothetical protein
LLNNNGFSAFAILEEEFLGEWRFIVTAPLVLFAGWPIFYRDVFLCLFRPDYHNKKISLSRQG